MFVIFLHVNYFVFVCWFPACLKACTPFRVNSADPSSNPSSTEGNLFAADSVESGMSSRECSDEENEDLKREKDVNLQGRARSASPSEHLVETASESRVDVEGDKLDIVNDPDVVKTPAHVTSGLSMLNTPVELSGDSKNSESVKEETEMSVVLRSADSVSRAHVNRIEKEKSKQLLQVSTTASDSRLGKKLPKGTASQKNLGTNVGSSSAVGSGVPKLSSRTPVSSRSAMSGSISKSNSPATLPSKKPGPLTSSRTLASSATSKLRPKVTEAENARIVSVKRTNEQRGDEALSRDENGNITPGRRERNPMSASSQTRLQTRVKAASPAASSPASRRVMSATRGAIMTATPRNGSRTRVGGVAPQKQQQEPPMSCVGILDANDSDEFDLNPKVTESLTEIFSGKTPPL